MSQIGVYETKTHLPQLLEKVAGGERVTITRHGRPVAVLQPVEGATGKISDLIHDMKQFRRGKTLQGASIQEMIAEGRD